jgi:two-component system, OmpR family, response regulator
MARILIVDDTEIVLKALDLAVRRMGHDVESTTSPINALAVARVSPPDLLLLDLCMPEMDGVALLEQIRAALGKQSPRVLFVSAVLPEDLNPSVMNLKHVAGYVKKPFLLEELSRAVAAALSSP